MHLRVRGRLGRCLERSRRAVRLVPRVKFLGGRSGSEEPAWTY